MTHTHTLDKDGDFEWVKICSGCNKTNLDLRADPNEIDPSTKVSQQPHGNQTMYCNMCSMYVKPDQDGDCPYHQKVMVGEEGPYLKYDEFNQDGEEL